MVTVTVYVNSEVFCWIVNILNKSMTCEWVGSHKDME
ncbi:hypothetical protein M2444_004807 [Paenibacillus sp. PastF-3]|nr:hypothetical protein [Paenibacillus sp. PastF-3]